MIASVWHRDIQAVAMDDARKQWLIGANRLVQAFKRILNEDVVINALQEQQQQPFDDECTALRLVDQIAHIREIVIASAMGHTLCYARVVIPQVTYQAYAKQFSGLGRQFIGDSLLYNNAEVTRQPFEFACFQGDTHYAAAYCQLLNLTPISSDELWPARRSIFLWKNRPLLITEFLLPYLATVPYTYDMTTNGETHEL